MTWNFTLPLAFLVLTLAAGRAQLRVGPQGDEPHYLMVAESLLRDGDLSLERDYAEALKRFQAAGDYPENLAVGRPRIDRRGPQVNYLVGTALEALGERDRAREAYQKAAAQQETRGFPDRSGEYARRMAAVQMEGATHDDCGGAPE